MKKVAREGDPSVHGTRRLSGCVPALPCLPARGGNVPDD